MTALSELQARYEQEAAAVRCQPGAPPNAFSLADFRVIVLSIILEVNAAKKKDRLKTGRTA